MDKVVLRIDDTKVRAKQASKVRKPVLGRPKTVLQINQD